MTHVMVPDGVLPWWLSAVGWIVTTALLGLATWRLRSVPATRMVPLVGVMTAVMAAIMSVELVPIGYEFHLTVLTGMVIGPWYGIIAALLFNVLRALIGDGAFTNVGLNAGITWLEIALGAAIWAALRPLAQRAQPHPALIAGVTAFVSLMLSTFVFIGVVGLSTVDPASVVDTAAYDLQTGRFIEAPFREGLVKVHGPEARPADQSSGVAERGRLARFAVAVLLLGALGSLVEAALTAAIVAFVAQVRPDLLGLRLTRTALDVAGAPTAPAVRA